LSALPLGVWTEFQKFLWKIDDPQALWNLGLAHIQESSIVFTDIFRHFLPAVRLIGSLRECFAREFQLLRLGFFEGVALTLKDLVNDNKELLGQSPELVAEMIDAMKIPFLPYGVVTDLADACADLSALSPENRHVFEAFLEKLTQLSFEHWSCCPDPPKQTDLNGLRNLGATCYMNAVFQQLFRIPAFQYLLLKAEADRPDLRELKVLFHKLMFSKRPSCDPTAFAETWVGWDKKPIRPHEQQDANEFFQLLLDTWPPSLSSLFRGQVLVSIESLSEEHQFKAEVVEDFVSLGLGVSGISSSRFPIDP
jgi:hypothetical protein